MAGLFTIFILLALTTSMTTPAFATFDPEEDVEEAVRSPITPISSVPQCSGDRDGEDWARRAFLAVAGGRWVSLPGAGNCRGARARAEVNILLY